MQTAHTQTAPSKAHRTLMVALTLAAIGVALIAAPLGFLGGSGLHRIMQPQRSPVHASFSTP